MTSLPLDVLHKIFSFLNWSEVQMCAAVCKGWEATANEACELKWKEECKQDYAQIYQEAYRKSRLSWAQLYKSLRLWPHIKATKIYLHYSDFLDGGDGYSAITGRQTKKIQVLKNGIIGYPICMVNESGDSDSSEGRRINLKKLFRGHRSYCNTIVYYDPETLQEISRRDLDFEFNNYEENDDLIVLRRHNNEDGYSLCIITKANQLIHNIGSMVQYTWGDISKFYLVGNKVFFLSKDYKIWMSKLVLDNGEAAIQTAHFANYNLFPELDGIEAFSFINDNQVNVLTSRGNIFSIVEQKLVKLGRVKKEIDNRNEVVAMLKQYGFQWSTPAVYKWICGHDIIDGDWVAITHLKHVTVHSHDCVVFIDYESEDPDIYTRSEDADYSDSDYSDDAERERISSVVTVPSNNGAAPPRPRSPPPPVHDRDVASASNPIGQDEPAEQLPELPPDILKALDKGNGISAINFVLPSESESYTASGKREGPTQAASAERLAEDGWEQESVPNSSTQVSTGGERSLPDSEDEQQQVNQENPIEDTTPPLAQSYPGVMPFIRQAFSKQSLAPETVEIMIASLSPNSLKQYNVVYKKWWSFCNSNNVSNCYAATIPTILKFLTQEFNSGASYSTLNSCRSGLALILGKCISADSSVNRFFKGVYKTRPCFPKYESTWDTNKVLDFLAQWYPNEKISLENLTKKLVTLLALSTAQRVQTLSLIKLSNIKVNTDSNIEILVDDIIKTSAPGRPMPRLILPFFHDKEQICPAKTLTSYINLTQVLRQGTQCDKLVLTIKKPVHSASASTISRWIKQVLFDSGIDTAVFSAHSTRHAATSAAGRRGVSIELIKKTAGTSVRTLHVYYNPYVKGQLRLYNRKPTLKIDLNDHVPLDDEEVPSEQRRIMQIDVMEIPNGHRVLLLYCQRLVAIEFHNDPTKRPLDQYENVASRPRCDLYRRIN